MGTSRRWKDWDAIGAPAYEARAVRYGIVDMPSVPFECGVLLPTVPQSPEDLAFGTAELAEGCRAANRFYEEVTEEEAMGLVGQGKMVSSAFVNWQGEDGEREGAIGPELCSSI